MKRAHLPNGGGAKQPQQQKRKNYTGAYTPKASELQEKWGLPIAEFEVLLRIIHHGDGKANPMKRMCFFNPKSDEVNELAKPLDKALPHPEEWLPLPRYFQRTTVCVYWRGGPHGAAEVESAKARVREAWKTHGFIDDEQPEASMSQES